MFVTLILFVEADCKNQLFYSIYFKSVNRLLVFLSLNLFLSVNFQYNLYYSPRSEFQIKLIIKLIDLEYNNIFINVYKFISKV